jgi:transposase
MLLLMYRVTLTADHRHELQRRTRQPGIVPSTRDRLELVRLSDAGWRVPKIAHQLGWHEQTVRTWIKACIARGFDARANNPRGGDHAAVTSAMLDAARAEVAKGTRTWRARAIADWVAAQHGGRSSPGRMRVQLKRATRS